MNNKSVIITAFGEASVSKQVLDAYGIEDVVSPVHACLAFRDGKIAALYKYAESLMEHEYRMGRDVPKEIK